MPFGIFNHVLIVLLLCINVLFNTSKVVIKCHLLEMTKTNVFECKW